MLFHSRFWRLELSHKSGEVMEVNGNQMPVCVRDVGIFLVLL